MPFGIPNPFKGRQPGTSQTTAPPPPSTQQPGPTTGPLSTEDTSGDRSGARLHESSQIHLVNYSPEEQMQQIDQTLSRVHFGMSLNHRFKEMIAEIWSVIGPMVLFAGTAGEVFFFIWNNVAPPGQSQKPAWWVALS